MLVLDNPAVDSMMTWRLREAESLAQDPARKWQRRDLPTLEVPASITPPACSPGSEAGARSVREKFLEAEGLQRQGDGQVAL